ncbi:MAG: hypothetical protein ACOH2H_24020 [Cypionkella sp.]
MKRSYSAHSSSDIRPRAKLISLAEISLNRDQRAMCTAFVYTT